MLLLVHTQPVGYLARIAATRALSSADLSGLRVQLVAYAVAALVVLLVVTGLSIYKPRGRTLFGARKPDKQGCIGAAST